MDRSLTPGGSAFHPSITVPATSASAHPAPSASAVPSGSAAAGFHHPPARTEGCPDGMVRVEGDYCPAVLQRCLRHHEEYERNPDGPTVSERCLRYAQPTKCAVKQRRNLSFCMDRYEYPNEVGELPWVLTSWRQAQWLCAQENKRLCTEDEYNFACEGPEMLPHVYGFDRDQTKCNIDQPYIQPDQSRAMLTYRKCLKDERCAAELERLDGRHRIGGRLTCVSWAGVVDLNGNVNEWVELVGAEPPMRSGLKGGWWGPVRNRCRPTVKFHKEYDYGYEAGFRCCRNLAGQQSAMAQEAPARATAPAPTTTAPPPAASATASPPPPPSAPATPPPPAAPEPSSVPTPAGSAN